MAAPSLREAVVRACSEYDLLHLPAEEAVDMTDVEEGIAQTIEPFMVASWAGSEPVSFAPEAISKEFPAVSKQSCGYQFKKGDLIYHCRDCAIDETCVLCEECFSPKDHEGHRIKYHMNREKTGGCCDCGEEESWRLALSCERHCSPSTAAVEKSAQQHHETPKWTAIKAKADAFFADLVKVLLYLVSPEGFAKDDASSPEQVLVLYNDERHSFDDVSNFLDDTLHVGLDRGYAFATIVDARGFAVVAPRHEEIAIDKAAWCESCTADGLSSQIEEATAVRARCMISRILAWMDRVATTCPFLRHSITVAITARQAGSLRAHADALESSSSASRLGRDDPTTFAELIMSLDNTWAWKCIRNSLQSILTCGLAFDEVKVAIMEALFKVAPKLIEELSLGTREPHLSILGFSVQILTVPSIARLAATRGMVERLLACFGPTFGALKPHHAPEEGHGDDEGSVDRAWRTDTGTVAHIIHMVGYISRDSSVIAANLLSFSKYSGALVEAVGRLQGRAQRAKRTDAHVPYDNPKLVDEINCTLMVVSFIGTLLKDLLKDTPDAHHSISQSIQTLLRATEEATSASHAMVSKETYGVSVSFQQPCLWIMGTVLALESQLVGEAFKGHALANRQVVAHLFYLMATFAQIKTGQWVRNGGEVNLQAAFLNHDISSNYMWLYYTVWWNVLASNPPSSLQAETIAMLEDIFFPACSTKEHGQEGGDDGPDARVFSTLLQWLMMVAFGTTLAMTRTQLIRYSLIHALAIGPAPYSKVRERTQGTVHEDRSFDDALKSVALYRETDSLTAGGGGGGGVYELSPLLYSEYTPYFWLYSAADQIAATSFMEAKRSFSRLALLQKGPPTSTLAALGPFLASPSAIALFIRLLLVTVTVKSLHTSIEETLVLLNAAHKSALCAGAGVDLKAVAQAALSIHSSTGHSAKALESAIELFYREASDKVKAQMDFVLPPFFPALFLGPKSDTASSAGGTSSGSSLSSSAQGKAEGALRRQRILEEMRSRQAEFVETNEDAIATAAVISGDSEALHEAYEMTVSGTCIICHKPADRDTQPYSIPYLSNVIRIVELRNHLDPDRTVEMEAKENISSGSSECFSSCFHIMHDDCAAAIPLRIGRAKSQSCPLCGTLFNNVLPITARPTACKLRLVVDDDDDDYSGGGGGEEDAISLMRVSKRLQMEAPPFLLANITEEQNEFDFLDSFTCLPDPNPHVSFTQAQLRAISAGSQELQACLCHLATCCHQIMALRSFPADIARVERNAAVIRARLIALLKSPEELKAIVGFTIYAAKGFAPCTSKRYILPTSIATDILEPFIGILVMCHAPASISSASEVERVLGLARYMAMIAFVSRVHDFSHTSTTPQPEDASCTPPGEQSLSDEVALLANLFRVTACPTKTILDLCVPGLAMRAYREVFYAITYLCECIFEALRLWIGPEAFPAASASTPAWQVILGGSGAPPPARAGLPAASGAVDFGSAVAADDNFIVEWVAWLVEATLDSLPAKALEQTYLASPMTRIAFLPPPTSFDGFFSRRDDCALPICKRCPTCSSRYSLLLCFTCFEPICMSCHERELYETRQGHGGPLDPASVFMAHNRRCGRDQGMFYHPRTCALALVLFKTKIAFIPAPYVDEHGESDVSFKRGGPLFLSHERWRHLCRMLILGNLHASIAKSALGQP